MQEMQVQSLGQEYPVEKKMATHSSILAWEIPWTYDLVGYSPEGLIHESPALSAQVFFKCIFIEV